MKRFLFFGCLALTASIAHARLGWTPDQCVVALPVAEELTPSHILICTYP